MEKNKVIIENEKLKKYTKEKNFAKAIKQIEYMEQNNIKISQDCWKCKVKMKKKYEVTGKLFNNNATLEGIINYECPKCQEVVFPMESVKKLEEWIEVGFKLVK